MIPGRNVHLVYLVLLSGTFAFSAPVVSTIHVEGNSVFPAREILGWCTTKENTPFTDAFLTNDLALIRENYKQSGYLATAITAALVFTEDSSRVTIDLTIDEGRQTIVGSIALHGLTHIAAGEVVFDLKPGNPLSESMLERDIDALLGRCEQAGFPFAQCSIETMARRKGEESDTLDIVLSVDEGGQVTIDEIKVEGNKETEPSVIVRETRIGSGEVFNPSKVDAIKPRLKRLNIFADVSDPELYERNDKNGLLIKVQEGSTNTFDGVIGYVPGSGANQSGYLTGLVSVSMRNLFGTGRKLSFRWAREDRSSQELGVRYLEPWIFNLPANIGGGFLQRQQDSTYVRRVLDVKAELMISEALSVSGLLNSESVIPSATDSLFSRVFESSIVTAGAELQYDTRDDALSPSSGARYRTDYQYGRKRLSRIPAALTGQVEPRSTLQRFTIDLDFYQTTFARQVLAVGVHGRELRTGQPEEGEMFRFGGSRTLRGFRENQFIGSRLAWTNLEYRFLLARRSFLFGFVDGGYYFRPADNVRNVLVPKTEAFKYGYGIGVQLETGLGVLGVSFALGSDNTSFSNATVHFGIINEF